MKKLYLAVCLAAVMMVLAACGSPAPKQSGSANTGNTGAAAANQTAAAAENTAAGTNQISGTTRPQTGTESTAQAETFQAPQAVMDYLSGDWAYFNWDEYADIFRMYLIPVNENQLACGLTIYDENNRISKDSTIGMITVKPLKASDPSDLYLEFTPKDGGEASDYVYEEETLANFYRIMKFSQVTLEQTTDGMQVAQITKGSSPFSNIADYTMLTGEGIYLEKYTDEDTTLTPHKNTTFTAVFWGWGSGSDGDVLYFNDCSQDDSGAYVSKVKESAPYTYAASVPNQVTLTEGEVYLVTTNKKGKVTSVDYADVYTGDGAPDSGSEDAGMEYLAMHVKEISFALENGQSLVYTENTETVDGKECRIYNLGENTTEKFTTESTYAYCADDNSVYKYDVANDQWNASEVY